jgi:hypothetical protein
MRMPHPFSLPVKPLSTLFMFFVRLFWTNARLVSTREPGGIPRHHSGGTGSTMRSPRIGGCGRGGREMRGYRGRFQASLTRARWRRMDCRGLMGRRALSSCLVHRYDMVGPRAASSSSCLPFSGFATHAQHHGRKGIAPRRTKCMQRAGGSTVGLTFAVSTISDDTLQCP